MIVKNYNNEEILSEMSPGSEAYEDIQIEHSEEEEKEEENKNVELPFEKIRTLMSYMREAITLTETF